MTMLIGQTGNVWGGIHLSQDYGGREDMIQEYRWAWGAPACERPWDDGALWPRSRFTGNGGELPLLIDGTYGGSWAGPQVDCTGGQQAKKLIGVSLDQAGAPLGSCTLDAFTTTDDVFRGSVVSDSGGYYELCTFVTGAHYIVGMKSPNLGGVTVNTLIPV